MVAGVEEGRVALVLENAGDATDDANNRIVVPVVGPTVAFDVRTFSTVLPTPVPVISVGVSPSSPSRSQPSVGGVGVEEVIPVPSLSPLPSIEVCAGERWSFCSPNSRARLCRYRRPYMWRRLFPWSPFQAYPSLSQSGATLQAARRLRRLRWAYNMHRACCLP